MSGCFTWHSSRSSYLRYYGCHNPLQPFDKPRNFNKVPETQLNQSSQIARALVLAGCFLGVLASCASPTIVGTWNCDSTTVEHELYTAIGENTFSATESGIIRSTIDYNFDFYDIGDLTAQVRIVGDWSIEDNQFVEVVRSGEIISMTNSTGVADENIIEMLLTMHPAGEVIQTEFIFESREQLRMTDLRDDEIYSCNRLSSDYE